LNQNLKRILSDSNLIIPNSLIVIFYEARLFLLVRHLHAPLSNSSQTIMRTEVNKTNALTMPTLITATDRPPNRRTSGRTNYALDDRADPNSEAVRNLRARD